MSEKELNLNIATNKEGKAEVVILHGEARKQIYPQQQELSGTIGGPSEFLKVRRSQVTPDKAVVIFDYQAMTIMLDVDPSDGYAPVINGALVMNKELEEFRINKEAGKKNAKSFANMLRMGRAFFLDKATCDATVNGFINWKAKISTDIETINTKKGHEKDSLEQKLENELNIKFALKIPIFKGANEEEFECEVMCSIDGAEVLFWLESVELQEMIILRRKELIDRELAFFETDYVTIQK